MGTNCDRKSFELYRKNSKFAQTTGFVDVFDPLSAFRDPLRGELPHDQIFMNDGPKQVT